MHFMKWACFSSCAFSILSKYLHKIVNKITYVSFNVCSWFYMINKTLSGLLKVNCIGFSRA